LYVRRIAQRTENLSEEFAMNEPLRNERLTTADIVNPPRAETGNQTATDAGLAARNREPVSIATGKQTQPNPLFPEGELDSFRANWAEVQTSFVDEPRKAVERADSLVANVVKRIAEQFAVEREQLEKQWDRGEDVNTEDLRQAFQRYRAFFDRLLSV
jgi:hypothetical protein